MAMAALATDDAVPGESAVGAAATSSKEVGRDVLGTKLLLRGRQGIHLMHGPNGGKGLDDAQAVATVAPDSSVAPAGGLAEFSPDGSLLARTGGIRVFDEMQSGSDISTHPSPSLSMLSRHSRRVSVAGSSGRPPPPWPAWP